MLKKPHKPADLFRYYLLKRLKSLVSIPRFHFLRYHKYLTEYASRAYGKNGQSIGAELSIIYYWNDILPDRNLQDLMVNLLTIKSISTEVPQVVSKGSLL